MIVFNLICKTCSVEFEGWFEDSTTFANQQRRKIINCPSCNSTSIGKSLVAPNLPKKSSSKKEAKLKKAVANNIKKYKKIVEENFEYVGEKFTEEAKKIKYGEKEERPIYGEATAEQTKELVEEEISVVPLPWASTKKIN